MAKLRYECKHERTVLFSVPTAGTSAGADMEQGRGNMDLLRVPNNSETHMAKTFDRNFRYLSIRNRYEITSQKGKLHLERAKKKRFLPAALSLACFARKLL